VSRLKISIKATTTNSGILQDTLGKDTLGLQNLKNNKNKYLEKLRLALLYLC